MTPDVPQWALDRVRECLNGAPIDAVAGGHIARSFAAYIAAHEEPPVDPLLIEARKLADAFWPGEGALAGKLDNAEWTARLTIALKRGLELAKEQSQ